MPDLPYSPDIPANPTDAMILAAAGHEPLFDPVMRDFLKQGYLDLQQRIRGRRGLLDVASLGQHAPWLFRLTFRTRGLIRNAEDEITTIERHVVALRFLPEYLRNAERFGMLRLIEPVSGVFHPNISASGALCIEVYPGESLVEICLSLHDLFRWRLRQYDERDAMNTAACAWGRENVDGPIDTRPLFGERLQLDWQLAAKE